MPCLRSDLQAMMMKGMRMMNPWPSPYLGKMVEGDHEDDDVLDDEVVVLLQLESLREVEVCGVGDEVDDDEEGEEEAGAAALGPGPVPPGAGQGEEPEEEGEDGAQGGGQDDGQPQGRRVQGVPRGGPHRAVHLRGRSGRVAGCVRDSG